MDKLAQLRAQREAQHAAQRKPPLGASTKPKPSAKPVTINRPKPVTINPPAPEAKRKRGRPSTGKALSGAERVRRYRARRRAKGQTR